MDRVGRVPVLAAGFAIGRRRAAARGARQRAGVGAGACSSGLVGVGAASGTALLARTAAGDMYPPERRARGIALVLFGAVFGAILGRSCSARCSPAASSTATRSRCCGSPPAASWSSALVLVLAVRPDPQRIAELLHTDAGRTRRDAAAPLREIVRRPGVIPALLAGQASFAVMVGVMTLTGAVVVDHHHHAGHNVFPIIGAHVLGMYALVLVIGELIDRIGRTPALAGGLLVMARLGHQPAVGRERAGHRGRAVRPRASAGTSRSSPPPPSSPTAPRRASAASCSASTTCWPG